jgi:hypothetical protein
MGLFWFILKPLSQLQLGYRKERKIMEKKISRHGEILCLGVIFFSFLGFSCTPQQSPPQVGAPPAGNIQPVPGTTPSVTPQAGNVQTSPSGTVSPDYNRIQLGMTPEQIHEIMGIPQEIKRGKTVSYWLYDNPTGGKIEVKFKDNKVIAVEEE